MLKLCYKRPVGDEVMVNERFMCIGSLYPSSGIDGVLGVVVQDQKDIGVYRKAVEAIDDEKITFVRLTSVPKDAGAWLQSGDVVCKYAGLSEPFLDVLREKVTVIRQTEYRPIPVDWEMIESVRQKSVESNKWRVDASQSQIVVSDPTGRVASASVPKGSVRRMFPGMYMAILESNRDRARVKSRAKASHGFTPIERRAATWMTFRFFHRALMESGGGVNEHWVKIRNRMKYVYELSLHFASASHVRVRTRRTSKYAKQFWSRICQIYLNRPETLPDFMQNAAQRKWKQELYCTLEEFEPALQYTLWDEWKDGYPPLMIDDLVPLKVRASAK